MWKDLINSLAGNMRERASSPILGSYTIAAIVCNWKPLVILFTSKETGTALANEIQSAFPDLQQGLLIPIIVSLIFSVLYPTLKSTISALNAYTKMLELKAEQRLENLRQQSKLKPIDVPQIIHAIDENYDNIGYHELLKIRRSLPHEEDLLIKNENNK